MRVFCAERDGRGFEREVLGHTVRDMDPKLRYLWVNDFKEGVRRIRRIQDRLGWDPSCPKTELGRCIFEVVASKLRREGNLYFFDAIGTVLDFKWGIDCWFECGGRIATVDLTVRPYKKHFKAHFLLRRNDFLRNRYYEVGRAIARKLSQ